MEKYFEINKNGQNIRCKLYYDKSKPIEKVVLYGHGFAGHKDNTATYKFADRILTKYKGIAVLIFNMPCHGDDVKKKLILDDCLNYIKLAIEFIKEEIHASEIYSYATSFGGYLILKYIHKFGNPFEKIALRCPAINMAETLTKKVIKEDELSKLLKGKPVPVGFDMKIEITLKFIQELEKEDIRKYDYIDYADDILILHGTKDEVIPIEESRAFAENNVIEFIPVENADHRFQNPASMEFATKKVLEFFYNN